MRVEALLSTAARELPEVAVDVGVEKSEVDCTEALLTSDEADGADVDDAARLDASAGALDTSAGALETETGPLEDTAGGLEDGDGGTYVPQVIS